jgi:hypothetical protein
MYTKEITLELTTCASCGIVFALVEVNMKNLRKSGNTFWCPNGHPLTFGETENDRLKEQLKYSDEQANHWKEEAQATSRSLIATKGVITRLKNRAASGLCPCCNQTFKLLGKHMAKMHPDFEKEEIK